MLLVHSHDQQYGCREIDPAACRFPYQSTSQSRAVAIKQSEAISEHVEVSVVHICIHLGAVSFSCFCLLGHKSAIVGPSLAQLPLRILNVIGEFFIVILPKAFAALPNFALLVPREPRALGMKSRRVRHRTLHHVSLPAEASMR